MRLCPGKTTDASGFKRISGHCQRCARYSYAIDLDPRANALRPQLQGGICPKFVAFAKTDN